MTLGVKARVSNFVAMLPPLHESEIFVNPPEEDKYAWMHDYLEDADSKRDALSPRSKNLASAAPSPNLFADV